MTLKLHIATDLEDQILREAQRRGLDAQAFILALIQESLASRPREKAQLQDIELVEEINQGLKQEVWNRYSELIGKRDAQCLTQEEHRELLGLVDQVELAQADRLESLAELASRHNKTLEGLMQEMGIRPKAHA